MSFGLDSGDRDPHLEVRELRNALHPSGGGASALPQLAGQIDGRTRILIKGCDLGRTREMVELIDEAFGGAGTVIAPTHEQVYGYDPTLAGRARERARAGVEAEHPMPAEVDPQLHGRDRAAAVRERRAALRQRSAQIAAELDEIAERAGTYEALSGPLCQRPGDQLFTAAEVGPEMDRLYGHLSEAQRARIARQLVAPDRRPLRTAMSQGAFRQQGQRVYTLTDHYGPYDDPQSESEALALVSRQLERGHFDEAVRITRNRSPEGTSVQVHIRYAVRTRRGMMEYTYDYETSPMPEPAVLEARLRERLPNPDRYRIRSDVRHAGGRTRIAVSADRVIAYLHHGRLDPGTHEHFTRPTDDPNFYTSSRFSPPRRGRRP